MNEENIVIAIDPGYGRIGIAIIRNPRKGKEELLFSECFSTDPKKTLGERVYDAGQEIDRLIKQHKPSVMAIENVYFEKNAKTVIGVSEAKGAFKYVAHDNGLTIFELTPPQIKTAITGNGRSSKDQVAWMVPKLIEIDMEAKIEAAGGSSKGLDDEIDAIAVGLTYCAHHNWNA